MNETELDTVFNPRSVAVVGVSLDPTSGVFGGKNFLNSLLNCGFKGPIYPVNRKGGEIEGLKVYRSVGDIPGPVDYVISSVPAPFAPELMKECIAKGAKGVHFYTSGFSEIGTEEGRRLEAEVYSQARRNGIRVIGPNGMGIYQPKAGLSFITDSSNESGSVGLISQSGGNAIYLIRQGALRGIRFSKAVSFGNACDVSASELLEYMADDPDTKIILAYIEGVKKGQKFKQALKRAASKKPVIVLKVGVSETGAMTAASHTGALSGSDRVWDGLLQQVGAIRVYSLDELLDMAVAFSYLPSSTGRKTAVVGVGGGATVLLADECTEAGLVMARIPPKVREKLSILLGNEAGTILNNPIDLSADAWRVGFYRILKILAECDDVDLGMVQLPFSLTLRPCPRTEMWEFLLQEVIRASREISKPLAVVIHFLAFEEDYRWMLDAQKRCSEVGIPTFHSVSGAARAIARFVRYRERKRSRG